MTPGQVIIHFFSPHGIPPEIPAACLTNDETVRASRFRFPKDAIHWSACRAALRQILGQKFDRPPSDIPLAFSEFGKPMLSPPYDGLHFNLSHCADLAIVALSEDGPVGVDLEMLARAPDLLECENSFCHPREIRALPVDQNDRANQLLKIWTAKEALLKSLGTGLSHGPELVHIQFTEFHATAQSEAPLQGIENQRIHRLQHPALGSYAAMISAPDTVNEFLVVEFQTSI